MRLLAGAAVLFMVALVPAGIAAWYYGAWALAYDLEKVREMPAATFVYDRDGYVIQRLFEENRVPVESDDIPEVLRQAVIAKEDHRFYYHPGFDPIAIARSALTNIRSGGIRTGASTITQQLARNSVGIFERTADRKLREVFMAMRIEAAFTKDEILTLYLNRIFFGGNLYGIGSAADAYFGKQPSELNLPESALLAGIIAAPNAFSPWRDVPRAREVREFTLQRMAARGFITAEQAAIAAAEPLILRPRRELPGSHVVGAVQDMLPRYISREILYGGGLHIHTTVDLAFQRHAEQEIEKHLARIEKTPGYRHLTRAAWLAHQKEKETHPDYLQAAFVAIHNMDGGILAMAGGRNHDESTYNRALYGARQAGSTVKPFVYAHAFQTLNFTAATTVDRSVFNLREFSPSEVLGNSNPDYITVREALARSDNYAAMRTGIAAGADTFPYFFSQFCDVTPPPYPSTMLGAFEITPLQQASAFSAFANYGVVIEPFLITRVATTDNRTIYQHIDTRRRIMSPQIAFQISHLLQGAVDEGTGRALRSRHGLKGDLAGKTGTTNEFKDSWFAGYTSEVTAAVWVGFDRPRPIMAGGYASRLAVPLWGAVMKPALEHYPPRTLEPPPGVQLAKVKSEEKVFLFFTRTQTSGRAEYIRDDQRGNALVRLEPGMRAGTTQFADAPLWRRVIDRVWSPEPPDQFAPETEPDSVAVIQDNPETHAPRAVPVR